MVVLNNFSNETYDKMFIIYFQRNKLTIMIQKGIQKSLKKLLGINKLLFCEFHVFFPENCMNSMSKTFDWFKCNKKTFCQSDFLEVKWIEKTKKILFPFTSSMNQPENSWISLSVQSERSRIRLSYVDNSSHLKKNFGFILFILVLNQQKFDIKFIHL